jgi:hypothetical protein
MALNRLVKDLGVVVGVGLIWLEAAAAAPAVVVAAPAAATVVVAVAAARRAAVASSSSSSLCCHGRRRLLLLPRSSSSSLLLLLSSSSSLLQQVPPSSSSLLQGGVRRVVGYSGRRRFILAGRLRSLERSVGWGWEDNWRKTNSWFVSQTHRMGLPLHGSPWCFSLPQSSVEPPSNDNKTPTSLWKGEGCDLASEVS